MLENKDIVSIIRSAKEGELPRDLTLLLTVIENNPSIQKKICDVYNQELLYEQEIEYKIDFSD